jgi:hypothetical protein
MRRRLAIRWRRSGANDKHGSQLLKRNVERQEFRSLRFSGLTFVVDGRKGWRGCEIIFWSEHPVKYMGPR